VRELGNVQEASHRLGEQMREQIYALCSPDGTILDEAVVGFAEATGLPQRGIALYTRGSSQVIRRDLEAHRDLGAQVRAVNYEEASEVVMRPGRITPPRVAINGHIFTQDAFLREVWPDLGLGLEPRRRDILEDKESPLD
jgi:hypothetical protein